MGGFLLGLLCMKLYSITTDSWDYRAVRGGGGRDSKPSSLRSPVSRRPPEQIKNSSIEYLSPVTAQEHTTDKPVRKTTQVVVYIPSPIAHKERRLHVNRQFARENWTDDVVVLLWVFGTRAGHFLELELNTTSVYEEPHMTSKNVVHVNCRDTGDEWNNPNGTSATTCKFYESIRYIHQHYDAKYVIRGADDAYLNVRKFLSTTHEYPSRALWLGQARDSTRNFDLSISDKQPELAKLFGLTHFSTNYMLGMGFVFSWDVVELIGNWNIEPHLTWCEDVMVGMFLNVFRLNRVSRTDLFVNRNEMWRYKKNIGRTLWNYSDSDGLFHIEAVLLHYILPTDWNNIDDSGMIHIDA